VPWWLNNYQIIRYSLIIVNAHNNSTKDEFRKMKEPNLFLDILPALNKTSATLKTVLPFHLNRNGKPFIRLRQNTLQLVGAKRRSRLRGCGELHLKKQFFLFYLQPITRCRKAELGGFAPIEVLE